ncbi:MAG: hypothetical protein BRD32_00185 [Bacteroidetes bacterium QH_2_64_74]|nr:MAG: hypothetical protein BRD32_00185 [Bacteroidetes bacterium QH_2_64_74]
MTAHDTDSRTSFLNYGSTSMPLRLSAVPLLVAILLVVPPASGQQADTTQLPEIAPREIEIRGERQIALPSLERQPLTGFASPPQVPAVPPDHEPYVGSYTYPLGNLPESLPVPETVSAPMEPTAEPARGFLEGGSGRYFSRFFEGRMSLPLSGTERLSLHGQYDGTEADPDDDVAEARLRLESTRSAVRLDAEARGTVQRYALFGATPTPDTLSEVPNREGYTAGGSLRLRSTNGSSPLRGEMRFDRTQYTSGLDAEGDGRVFTQQQLGLQGTAGIPIPYRPVFDARYQRSWLGGDPEDDTAFDLKGSGTVSFLPTASTSVEVGATVLAYDTLHLRNQPRLGDTALNHLYATNPYARHAPSLRPTLETTNAELGVRLTRGPVRLIAGAGYRYAPTYRFFSLTPDNGQGDYENLYRVSYDGAQILQGRGEVALQGIDGVQASLGLSVRDGTLESRDADIPNFAPVTVDAMVSLFFAGGDGFITAQGRFESSRDASTAPQALQADPYLSVDLEGSYAVSSRMEIVAKAEHLSWEAPTRWAAYPRPPAQVSAGLRLTW